MQLSPNFSTDEMLRSETATRHGFNEQFMPSNFILDNLKALCINVLEPLRALLNKPIHITSGYRCYRTNIVVGGSAISQHIDGEAADIRVDDMTVDELYDFIKKSDINYDQCINEFSPTGWVHVSYRQPTRHSCLIATKVNGQTLYTPNNT